MAQKITAGASIFGVVLLIAILREMAHLTDAIEQHNKDQTRFSAIYTDYLRTQTNSLQKMQADIARIDATWQAEQKERKKHELSVEIFNRMLKEKEPKK